MAKIRELEEDIACELQLSGVIWTTYFGKENIYYTDYFDNNYFCKNFPDLAPTKDNKI